MSSSDDAGEVRRGLEAALLGLTAMAQLMDRLGDLLVDWDTRSTLPTRASGTWRLAVNELRAVVMLAQAPVSEARSLAPAKRPSLWPVDDVRGDSHG